MKKFDRIPSIFQAFARYLERKQFLCWENEISTYNQHVVGKTSVLAK